MNPTRRQCLRWATGLLGAGLGATALARAPLVWRQRALLGFGTTLWLKAGHDNADLLESALDAAVAAIRDVEWQMSLFDGHSALSRLNARAQLRNPDPALVSVLQAARKVSEASAGAFDVSMQPLWQLWSAASEQGATPSPQSLAKAIALVNWRAMEISPTMLRLNQPGMQLSLNGIAQGFAADRVKAVLQSRGIRHAQIDTGETALLGNAPGGQAWTLGIENAAGRSVGTPPLLTADGRAIATSSDAHTSFSADHRHHHIMDPRTGYSPTHWSSVTVLAPSCTLADALTKVFFMQPPEKVRPLAQRWKVDVVLQEKSGRWVSTLEG